MAGKRKRKPAAGQREDLSKPTVWRRQHGDFNPPSFDTDPDTGTVVVHHRAVDTLGQMLANGTITPEMHDAGAMFRMLFRSAALDAMARSALLRLPGADAQGRFRAILRGMSMSCDPPVVIALAGLG